MKIIDQKTALQGVTDALTLFPLVLSVGVCSPFGAASAPAAAVLALIAGAVFRISFVPTYLALLPVFTVAYRYGASGGCAAMLLGGVLIFALSFLPQRVRQALRAPAVWPAFLIAAAFSTTALQTTRYFGIGAVGGTVTEILRDYVSLGFHPNWRGILYGTIVMVVLITYPRKFKRLSRALPAAFVSLLITFPLHLLLVPDAAHSPVAELGAFSFRDLFGGVIRFGDIPVTALPTIVCSAVALAWIVAGALPDGASRGAALCSVCGGVLGVPPMQTDGVRRDWRSVPVAALLTLLLFCTPALFRMPIPSLAVILIVTAWQCVDWSAARRALRKRTFLFFSCAAILPVLLGMHVGTLAAILLGLAAERIADRQQA